MLTFLSSPKPFIGNDKENQYRAIRSWLLAVKGAEVILYGDSEGIEEAGRELNVSIVKNITSSPSGAPYFGAIAEHAGKHGKYDVQVYLNCDILLSGIYKASQVIQFDKFLFIGQRIDLFPGVIVDPHPDEYSHLVKKLFEKNQIKIHEATGIDYFMFTRNMWQGLSQIAIGRGGYDNALLSFCKQNRYPIIDGTLSVIALHQFHDYNHIHGKEEFVFYGSEARQNLLVAGRYSLLTVSDADYILDNYRLIYSACRRDYLRGIELKFRYIKKWQIASLLLRGIWRVLYAVKLVRKKEYKLDSLIETNHPIFTPDSQLVVADDLTQVNAYF
ncbi:MAG: hypothetical protein AAB255_04180 [Bacteroidota bacterium]